MRANPSQKNIRDLRIMLIDDEPLELNMTHALLSHYGFQKFLMFQRASDARDLLLTEDRLELLPDVVIVDYNLSQSDISSLDFIRQVGRLDAAMPIICLTSRKPLETLATMQHVGVTDFIFKPLTDLKNSDDLIHTLYAAARIASFDGRRRARLEGLKKNRLRFQIA